VPGLAPKGSARGVSASADNPYGRVGETWSAKADHRPQAQEG